jgi:malate/lactate dehydrogenase
MEKNVMIFRTMGKALERHVKPECKVLVVGNPSHTNAWICASTWVKIKISEFSESEMPRVMASMVSSRIVDSYQL